MSDTITANLTTVVVSSTNSRPLDAGTRVQVVTLDGSSVLQSYVTEIGTIVSHAGGRAPLVRFPISRSGDNNWYVTSWRVLPNEGQRVTVTECMEYAQPDFRDWAVGREATYLSTDIHGKHLVRFDTTPNAVDYPNGTDYPNPASVEHLRFALGGPVIEERERRTPDERTYAVREREAREKYDALVQAINDLAEREEWCGNFEEWAEENDVPVFRSREKEYNVDIDLTYEISADSVATFLRREFGGEHDDVNADDVTVTSSVGITMTLSGGETPHDADSYTVENALSDANYSGYTDYNITDYSESN